MGVLVPVDTLKCPHLTALLNGWDTMDGGRWRYKKWTVRLVRDLPEVGDTGQSSLLSLYYLHVKLVTYYADMSVEYAKGHIGDDLDKLRQGAEVRLLQDLLREFPMISWERMGPPNDPA